MEEYILSRNDISSIGWEAFSGGHIFAKDDPRVVMREGEYFIGEQYVSYDFYELSFYEGGEIIITDLDRDTIFHGRCKTKEELSKLMEQLGIPNDERSVATNGE